MKTILYWTIQHSRQAVHEFRLRTTYWWLSQQVEFLEWRMRWEVRGLPAESNPVPTPVGQGG
ncbi:MAG: hypothetical protein E8D41_07045 [Nitrospira sp.]|nr:MAG: hypothetical protein E8D41_07045 [Nitrospira sp.]